MGALLAKHGAHNYSISLHPTTRQLFYYVEIEDEARWAAVKDDDVCKRWWACVRRGARGARERAQNVLALSPTRRADARTHASPSLSPPRTRKRPADG